MRSLWEIKHHYEIKGYEVIQEYVDELKALIAHQVAELQSHRLDEHSALTMLDVHFQKFIRKNRGVVESLHEIKSFSADQLEHRREKLQALVTQFFNSHEGRDYLRQAARDLLDVLSENTEQLRQKLTETERVAQQAVDTLRRSQRRQANLEGRLSEARRQAETPKTPQTPA